MIFVNKDLTMGSRSFTVALADVLRPNLKDLLTADEFDDFELDLTQVMIHFGDFSHENFAKVFNIIENSDLGDEKYVLLKLMKSDPRFKP